MRRGTFFRSAVLPTCSTTKASSGMRQSVRPRSRAPGDSENIARSTPNGTTWMRRSSPSQVASSRFSHSVPTMKACACRNALSACRRKRLRSPSRQPSVGERSTITGIRSCTVTTTGRRRALGSMWA